MNRKILVEAIPPWLPLTARAILAPSRRDAFPQLNRVFNRALNRAYGVR